MKTLSFIAKGAALSLAAVIILAMLGIGPLAIAYVALAIGDLVAPLAR